MPSLGVHTLLVKARRILTVTEDFRCKEGCSAVLEYYGMIFYDSEAYGLTFDDANIIDINIEWQSTHLADRGSIHKCEMQWDEDLKLCCKDDLLSMYFYGLYDIKSKHITEWKLLKTHAQY